MTLSRLVAHNAIKEKTTADLMAALSCMYEKLYDIKFETRFNLSDNIFGLINNFLGPIPIK